MDDWVVFRYTAKEAEDDGVLFNVTEIAKEYGFRWTTRISAGVRALCNPDNDIEYKIRLGIVLYMAVRELQKNGNIASIVPYTVNFGNKSETLWIGLDTTMNEPAIHIYLPSEH